MLALREDDLEEREYSLCASRRSFSICALRCTGRDSVVRGGESDSRGGSTAPAVDAICDWKCSSTHESGTDQTGKL